MVLPEDERYEEILRRLSRVEVLATLAFIDPNLDIKETRRLLRRYSRDHGRSSYSDGQRFIFDDEFEFLLDRLSSIKPDLRGQAEHDLKQFQKQQIDVNQYLSDQLEGVQSNLDQLSTSLETLEQKNTDLSAGTHEWLAIQSLGIDSSEVKVSRFLPLRIYLSDTPANSIEAASEAINQLLEAFDFEISDDFPPIRGSWFKKWFAKTKDAANQPEVIERLQKVERALELKGLGQPQSDIDKKQSQAVANLIKATKDVPNAAIQVGSILLVKISATDGPAIQVRTLTQRELIQLENNQKLLSSPADILEKLSELCRESDRSNTIQVPENIKFKRAKQHKTLDSPPAYKAQAISTRSISSKKIDNSEAANHDIPRLRPPDKDSH